MNKSWIKRVRLIVVIVTSLIIILILILAFQGLVSEHATDLRRWTNPAHQLEALSRYIFDIHKGRKSSEIVIAEMKSKAGIWSFVTNEKGEQVLVDKYGSPYLMNGAPLTVQLLCSIKSTQNNEFKLECLGEDKTGNNDDDVVYEGNLATEQIRIVTPPLAK